MQIFISMISLKCDFIKGCRRYGRAARFSIKKPHLERWGSGIFTLMNKLKVIQLPGSVGFRFLPVAARTAIRAHVGLRGVRIGNCRIAGVDTR